MLKKIYATFSGISFCYICISGADALQGTANLSEYFFSVNEQRQSAYFHYFLLEELGDVISAPTLPPIMQKLEVLVSRLDKKVMALEILQS